MKRWPAVNMKKDAGAESEKPKRDPLGEREGADERLFVHAKEFHAKAYGGIKHKIETDDLAGAVVFGAKPV